MFLTKVIVGMVIASVVGVYDSSRKNGGKLKKPRNLKTGWDLGFLGDCMGCALSAMVVIAIVDPSVSDTAGWLRLIFLSTVAAFGKDTVFKKLEDAASHLKVNALQETRTMLDEELPKKDEGAQGNKEETG
ncbi:DUF4257 domain-containing protein [Bacillus salitolerans]|uniref:DUF4257 domain-containing protein n=1 Tax=Bacillus salitolerans TaxID=1437434 RepID=A0ABW4LQ01_9BACI